jgi:hypothetical protein
MIITVAGVTEVVEHNGGEGFTLSDDPQLIRQALDSLARGECRGSPDVDPAPSAP